jgi:peptide/nickel transport system permease protein
MATSTALTAVESDAVSATPGTGRQFWSMLTRSKWVTVGLIIFVLYILIAIIGPIVAPYAPGAITVTQGSSTFTGTSFATSTTLQAPSLHHLLGTTQTGQDVLSQMLVSFGPSLEIGFLAGVIATALSIIIGVSAGYYAGNAGEVLSLISNVFLVIPAIPLLIVISSLDNTAPNWVYALALAALGWAWGARVLRAQTIALAQSDFVLAAKASGESAWRIIIFEILPNEAPVVATSFVYTVVGAISGYVVLCFLGLANINVWNFGTMLYYAQSNQAFSDGAWWWYVPPGIAVALILLALVCLSFGIDEFINPRLRASGGSRREQRAATRQQQQGITPVIRTKPALTLAASGGEAIGSAGSAK